MKDELISKVMDEVMKKMGASDATSAPAAACCNNGSANCNLTEFVGTAIGHTIGLVIANVDHQIHEKMDIDPKYRSIGIIGDRTGAGPQIFAADEAVKATNCEIVKIELPRDTEGGAGHGSLIILAPRTCPMPAAPLRSACGRWSAPWATYTAAPPATWSSSTPPAPATP